MVKHPGEQAAFHAFVNRFTSEADYTTYSMAQSPEEIKKVEHLIQQKLTQTKSN